MFESTTGATQASSVSGRRQSEEDRASAEKLKVFEFEKAKTILYAITSKDMATAAASWIAQQLPLGKFSDPLLPSFQLLQSVVQVIWCTL